MTNEQYLAKNASITMNTLFVEDHHSIDVFHGEASLTIKIGGSNVSFLCGSPDHARMFTNQLLLAIKENKTNNK